MYQRTSYEDDSRILRGSYEETAPVVVAVQPLPAGITSKRLHGCSWLLPRDAVLARHLLSCVNERPSIRPSQVGVQLKHISVE